MAFPPALDEIKNAIAITVLFVPFHQAFIDVWKLFGVRTRRYWEALTYVVYGTETGPKLDKELDKEWTHTTKDFLMGFVVGIPTTFEATYREECRSGPQLRLIQSFLLRAVGDSPVTEVSDADIRNVSDIARLSASECVQQTAEALNELIRSEIRNPQDAIGILTAVIQDCQEDRQLQIMLSQWIQVLQEEGVDVSPTLFYVWRVQFIEKFLPGVLRAERELGNALKAAEFRYHSQLGSITAILAAAEALGINWVFIEHFSLHVVVVGFVFSFGILMLGAQAGNSLLEAIIGIAARLKK